MYTIKAMIRWVRYQMRVGVTYHPYEEWEAGTYQGWYDHFGSCIAFKRDDGSVQWLW